LAMQRTPSYVCFANVHMTIEAYGDKLFQLKVNAADLVLADGKPIASASRLLHHSRQERISGMDFIPAFLKRAGDAKLSVFIYGSTDEVMQAMREEIRQNYPDINLAG